MAQKTADLENSSATTLLDCVDHRELEVQAVNLTVLLLSCFTWNFRRSPACWPLHHWPEAEEAACILMGNTVAFAGLCVKP